jgi:hypothetical protein
MSAEAKRGPRTANEKAHDVAQRMATAIEDLPPSALADDYLRPMATFLRFLVGSASARRAAEAEAAYYGLLNRVRYFSAAFGGTRPGSTNRELLVDLKEVLAELNERVWNYVDVAEDSEEALDEGLALVMKLKRLVDDAEFGRRGIIQARQALERAGARSV